MYLMAQTPSRHRAKVVLSESDDGKHASSAIRVDISTLGAISERSELDCCWVEADLRVLQCLKALLPLCRSWFQRIDVMLELCFPFHS